VKTQQFVLVDDNGGTRAILPAEGGPHQRPALVNRLRVLWDEYRPFVRALTQAAEIEVATS
jgi:hypothetical protein